MNWGKTAVLNENPSSPSLRIEPCPECGFPAVFQEDKFRCLHCGAATPFCEEKTEKPDVWLNERLYSLNAEAMKFFQWLLAHQPKSKAYAESRGLTDPVCKEFGIGASASNYGDSTVTRNLLKKGFSADDLVLTGISCRDEHGMLIDRYIGRLMFPIFTAHGKVAGFSGRTMIDAKAKYVNSPESPIFQKSHLLFMENRAFAPANKAIVLCEGQMDAVTQQIYGINCAMATLGTALSEYNVARIKTTGKPIYLCFDADNAGVKATARAIGMFGVNNVKVVNLAPYKDPDELLRAVGKAGYAKCINAAIPADKWLVQHSENPIKTALMLLEKEFYGGK